MTATVAVAADTDLDAVAAIASALTRGPSSAEDLRSMMAAWRDPLVVVARDRDDVVGYGFLAPWPGEEENAHVQADLAVLPARRGRGIGTTLLAALSRRAVEQGKQGLRFEVFEDDPDALSFAEHRGYVEVERQMQSVLELTEAAEPPPPPQGVVVVTRADRPDLLHEMHAVAVEAERDIPGLDGEAPESSFEEWKAWEVDRPTRRPDLCAVALVDGEVAGYAALDVFAPGTEGFHGLVAVARRYRRRGVGRALMSELISRARAAGLERLHIESEQRNVAMRSLSAAMGYRPRPSLIVLQGPPVP